MIATVLLSLAAIACQPDPAATRESREATVVEMNLQAKSRGVNMTFDASGIEARTLIIHSDSEQTLSDAARCQLTQAGFTDAVDVYGGKYSLFKFGAKK